MIIVSVAFVKYVSFRARVSGKYLNDVNKVSYRIFITIRIGANSFRLELQLGIHILSVIFLLPFAIKNGLRVCNKDLILERIQPKAVRLSNLPFQLLVQN